MDEVFRGEGIFCREGQFRSGAGMKQISAAIMEACKEKIERDRKRGILNRPVRAMVVGIPNVGKSTFINSFAGKACAKTGNKPGVTKGAQWIRLNKQVELLDTPGILWPAFENQTVGERLAMIGSINDEILHADELAMTAIRYITEAYPGLLQNRYEIEETKDAYEMLKAICKSRHCYLKGEEPDVERASKMVMEDVRSGKIGKLTLERPEEWQ